MASNAPAVSIAVVMASSIGGVGRGGSVEGFSVVGGTGGGSVVALQGAPSRVGYLVAHQPRRHAHERVPVADMGVQERQRLPRLDPLRVAEGSDRADEGLPGRVDRRGAGDRIIGI